MKQFGAVLLILSLPVSALAQPRPRPGYPPGGGPVVVVPGTGGPGGGFPAHPVYPVNPGYPGQPAYPSHPQPGFPAQPAYPVHPGFPGGGFPGHPGHGGGFIPGHPGHGGFPGGGFHPGFPPAPIAYPVQPAFPSYPGYPGQPAYPSYPTQPAYPVHPVQPTYPLQPIQPIVVQPANPNYVVNVGTYVGFNQSIDLVPYIRTVAPQGSRIARINVVGSTQGGQMASGAVFVNQQYIQRPLQFFAPGQFGSGLVEIPYAVRAFGYQMQGLTFQVTSGSQVYVSQIQIFLE